MHQNKKDVLFYAWLQYEFFREWEKFKKYANRRGIQIIGDLPIYVAEDSADAWAHPELFQMDADRRLTGVAGCPPDAFSPTGQLWGNPLYNWEYHKSTGYSWWIKRVKATLSMYDVVRIDHFRGFDEYYSIGADEATAENGHWERGPGKELFDAIKKELGDINVIAEDLGLITDSVREMVHDCGFPNMKILQFAFDARERKMHPEPNCYLPFTYDKNCAVYTGTHDNETLRGFLSHISKKERRVILDYLGKKTASDRVIVRELIRLAYASTADWCIIPLQDFLFLGNEARINEPSTLGTNWRWRLKRSQLRHRVQKEMKYLSKTYWRN